MQHLVRTILHYISLFDKLKNAFFFSDSSRNTNGKKLKGIQKNKNLVKKTTSSTHFSNIFMHLLMIMD